VTGIEALGWTAARAETAVRAIAETLWRVFLVADSEAITTDAAARRIAEEALQRAGGDGVRS
jgi:hypothetical protein